MPEEEKEPTSLDEGQPSQTVNAQGQEAVAQPTRVMDDVPANGISEQPEAEEEAEPAPKKSALEIAAAAIKARREREEREQTQEQAKKLSLLAKIQKLDIGERCKLAREGDKDCRTILIRDGNKLVSMSVLGNPKLTLQEVEFTAASRNVDEDILRDISRNREWFKEYAVVLALANNPKTPVGVALTCIQRLKTRDLRSLAKNKGVPEAVRVSARRLAATRDR
jgi:hypothetical protein